MARRYSKQTFTKIWTNRILWFGCIWISLTYVLAFFDKVNIAETLSKTAMTVIISSFVAYLLKSFFETKEEKKNEIEIMKFQQEIQQKVDELDLLDLALEAENTNIVG